MTVAAQVASVVGCIGLAALLLAEGRMARLAGLVAWGAGLGVLGIYLLPDLSRTRLAAAAVGGLAIAIGVAVLLRYRPYALALATLACIPLRLPVDIGSDEVNLLLPLYAVIGGLALSLAWALLTLKTDDVNAAHDIAERGADAAREALDTVRSARAAEH